MSIFCSWASFLSSTLVFSSIDLLASIFAEFYLISSSFSAFLLSIVCYFNSVSIFAKASYLSLFRFSYSSNLCFSSFFFCSYFCRASSRRVALMIWGGPIRFCIFGGDLDRGLCETYNSYFCGFYSPTILLALFSFSLLISLKTSGRHKKHWILSV